MPRKQKWEFPDGITVTRAHVRVWMQTVGHRCPQRHWHHYVKAYDVPAKIARELAAGTFTTTIHHAASLTGSRPRQMRKPGTLARLRSSWPQAANDSASADGLSQRPLDDGFAHQLPRQVRVHPIV